MSEPVCIEPNCTEPADSERPIPTDAGDPVVELVCHDHAQTDAPQALS